MKGIIIHTTAKKTTKPKTILKKISKALCKTSGDNSLPILHTKSAKHETAEDARLRNDEIEITEE